jgi:hypothetical protein
MVENLGNWSLDAIVSAIKANLEAGLKTTTNYNFNNEHLAYIVHAKRAEMIKQFQLQGHLEKRDLVQEINCITLDCENLSLCCDTNTFDKTLHFILPNYIELDFVGIPDRDIQFKVYEDYDFRYNKFKDRRLTDRPYVSIRNYQGVKHGFLFNPPTENIQKISTTLILENPLDVNMYDCCSLDKTYGKYPMPNFMVQQLIDQITSNWSSWMYRFQGYKPNNQTSLA